jgi:V8-like Glu-specific endopeptidase
VERRVDRPALKMTGPRALAAVIAVLAVILAGGCSAAPAVGHRQLRAAGPAGFWTRSRLLDARPLHDGQRFVPLPRRFAGSHPAVIAPRVGALFAHNASGNHFCTASVVASPGQDLLITAAHCINGGQRGGYDYDIVFIPGYRDGDEPFGVWTPQRLLVAPQWATSSDPDFDVGFVVLKPHDGENIQQVLGGNRLGIDSGYQHLVRVTGYPNSAGAPVTCMSSTSRQSATQLRFECGGYTDGTSGSPWVTSFDRRTRTGTIVGVIGGYQEGGNTPSVSYSPYLNSGIQRLYEQAITGGQGTLGAHR